MTLEQLDRHIADLESKMKEHQAELTAAKAFRPFLAKHEPTATRPVEVQPPLIPNTANGDGYGATMKNIRAAIDKCGSPYTIYNVEEQLSKMGVTVPRVTISQALSRMAKAKEITLHTAGSGRKPSTFKKEVATS